MTPRRSDGSGSPSSRWAVQAERDGLGMAQVTVLYLLLMGLAHRSQIDLGVSDEELRDEIDRLVRGWLDA